MSTGVVHISSGRTARAESARACIVNFGFGTCPQVLMQQDTQSWLSKTGRCAGRAVVGRCSVARVTIGGDGREAPGWPGGLCQAE